MHAITDEELSLSTCVRRRGPFVISGNNDCMRDFWEATKLERGREKAPVFGAWLTPLTQSEHASHSPEQLQVPGMECA